MPYDCITGTAWPFGDNISDLHIGITDSLNVQCVHAFSIDKGIFWLSWRFDRDVCAVDGKPLAVSCCWVVVKMIATLDSLHNAWVTPSMTGMTEHLTYAANSCEQHGNQFQQVTYKPITIEI